jgi:hypothetical protein
MEGFGQGDDPCSVMDKDHDLWQLAHHLTTLAKEAALLIKVVKVQAHEDGSSYTNPIDQWAVAGNAAADQAAQSARRFFSSQFWQVWDQVRLAYETPTQIRDTIHKVFVSVGQKASRTKKVETEPAEPNREVPDVQNVQVPVAFDPSPNWDDRDETIDLGECAVSVFDWLRNFTQGPQTEPMWICTYQMLCHYQLATGKIGPSCVAKVWIPGEHALKPHKQYDFLQQATWFGHYLRKLGKAFHLELEACRTRPAGTVIQFWNRCYKIRANAAVINGLDRLFESKIGMSLKKAAQFQGLPILKQDA